MKLCSVSPLIQSDTGTPQSVTGQKVLDRLEWLCPVVEMKSEFRCMCTCLPKIFIRASVCLFALVAHQQCSATTESNCQSRYVCTGVVSLSLFFFFELFDGVIKVCSICAQQPYSLCNITNGKTFCCIFNALMLQYFSVVNPGY
jgi:hypothetical protein